jgi:putative nucleotidyltransferase with HDIG domain
VASREEILLTDGRVLDRVTTPLRLDDGTYLGRVWFFRDISESKQARFALLRLNRMLATLRAVDAALVRATAEAELLDEMCRVCVEIGGYRLAWVGFADDDEAKSVRPVAWAGEPEDYLERARITWADSTGGRGPTGTAVRTGEVVVAQNVATDPAMAPWREALLGYRLESSAALPLVNGSDVVGILSLYSGERGAFGPDEIALLKEMAADLAFGISARRDRAGREFALRTMQENLKSMVQAIAAAVEMRDPYTAGHQRRVAELASAIAHEISLTDWQIEGLVLAATLHDVGKINVPAELLNKPGKLTPLEYQIIQTHVQTGYDIIKGINFPWPLAQTVLQHHERLDGSGYPNRLVGDAISIESRVLAVADVVDSMMSHRPYRPALGRDAALDEIESGKGRLYDPAVVDACTALFRQKGFEFPR